MKSMTGFGAAEAAGARGKVQVEARSYNHRFLDVRVRVSRSLQRMEPRIHAWARKRFVRGRLEVIVQWEDAPDAMPSLQLNEPALRFYLDLGKRLREEHGLPGRLSVPVLLRLREVVAFRETQENADEEWEVLRQALEGAATRLEAMQDREGETIRQDLLERIRWLGGELDRVRGLAEDLPERFREKLEERLARLLEPDQVDAQRIAQEIVLYADKVDITEEMVRLRSHLDACEKELDDGTMTGKRLDFLSQEIHRELNTIGSKSPKTEIIHCVVGMKTELEKIREQSQNLR